MKKNTILAIITLAVLAIAVLYLVGYSGTAFVSEDDYYASLYDSTGPVDIALVSPDRLAVPVTVELANTPERREEGLKNRAELDPGAGMLFVFPYDQMLNFWMKDTLIPLDIIFLDGDGWWVSHETMEPCPPEQEECPKTFSSAEARFALEVPAGFANQYRIGDRWRLGFPE